MTSETILTDEEVREILSRAYHYPLYLHVSDIRAWRAIEKAVMESPEIQRFKAIEKAAGEVLSIPREGGYIVLTVHLDALRAAMEKKYDQN